MLIKSLGELKKCHSNFKAIIIGRDGTSSYKKLAKKHGCIENLIFLGHVDEVEKYYAESDIYVHPTFYDSCSLVVTEALASGLPVITTIHDGASGVIDDGIEGFVLKDPTDYVTLAERIGLFFDEEFRSKASVAARNKAEKYPAERNCDEIVKVYKEVISKHIGNPTGHHNIEERLVKT
jgi:UDP-glucose:(heptosyl)LPS alpha-1,3-glucosyltransferase